MPGIIAAMHFLLSVYGRRYWRSYLVWEKAGVCSDPLAAVIVSFFIVQVAVKQLKACIDELLERSLPDDIEQEITQTVLSLDGVSQPHHLRTRRIGSHYAIDMHVRMDGSLSLHEAHEKATAIEQKLRDTFWRGYLHQYPCQNRKNNYGEKNISHRCQWVHRELFGGRCAGAWHAGVGRCAEEQQPEIFAGFTYPFCRTRLIPTVWPVSWRNRNASMGNGVHYSLCRGDQMLDKADFEIGNYWATRHFIETLKRLDMLPVNFYISSLSTIGPIGKKTIHPFVKRTLPDLIQRMG